MYEELIQRLREDAKEQERLLHVCNSTINAKEAADAIEALEKQLAEKESEIVRIRNSWSDTISDLHDVTAERDAAIADLNNIISMHQTCGLCGQSGYCMQDGKCNGWWYGLRKEKRDE